MEFLIEQVLNRLEESYDDTSEWWIQEKLKAYVEANPEKFPDYKIRGKGI